LESHLLAFFQGLEPVHLNGREMREQIFTAVIGRNEAESLRIVEPFDGTRRFGIVPLDGGCGRIRHADCLIESYVDRRQSGLDRRPSGFRTPLMQTRAPECVDNALLFFPASSMETTHFCV